MSGVSPPSDGAYIYYQRKVDDLEDEVDENSNRAEKRRQRDLDAAERSYNSELAKRDRRADEATQRVRDRSAEAIARERESAADEIGKAKERLYDSRGRMKEMSTGREQVASVQAESSRQQAKSRDQLSDAQEANARKVDALEQQNQNDLQNAVREARDSASEAYETEIESQKDSEKTSRIEGEKKYADATRQSLKEQEQLRKKYDQALSDVKIDYDRRLQKGAEAANHQLSGDRDGAALKMSNAVKDLNASHAAEATELRQQLKQLSSQGGAYGKGRAEGQVEAVKQYENEGRHRDQFLEVTFSEQLAKEKGQSQELEHHLGEKSGQSLHDKDVYYNDLLRKGRGEARLRERELVDGRISDRAQMQEQLRKDHELASKAQENIIERSTADRDAALVSQSKAYQDTLSREKVSTNEQIASLQKALKGNADSSDPLSVSPAAEAALRKQMVTEYEKGFDAEKARNSLSSGGIQQDYAERLKDLKEDQIAKETVIHQNNAAERAFDRNTFLEHVADTETLKNTALQEKDEQNRRQENGLSRSYSSLLERQRREFQSILRSQQSDSLVKLQSQRQDSDFQLKTTQRTFTAKQNELIRDYDKKLADQKVDYEAQLDDLKSESQHELRELGQKDKLATEAQTKMYDQRLAQVEEQHKERERIVMQNYEDEIEKLKRSNALGNGSHFTKKS